MAHIATTTALMLMPRTEIDHTLTSQMLPAVGGFFDKTYQEIHPQAVAISTTYVDLSAEQFLSMDWHTMEAMILGNTEAVPGMNSVRYNRTTFAMALDAENAPTAVTDILLAEGHEPSLADVRWLLGQLGQAIGYALSSSGVETFEGLFSRIMARLGMVGDVPWQDVDWSTTNSTNFPERWFIPPAPHGAPTDIGWREFFDGLDNALDQLGRPDAMSHDYGPDRCWRCDSSEAESEIGLCAPCLVDLKKDAP